MGQVTVNIAGRAYALGCRDGDEAHLSGLADGLDRRADDLTRQLGPMSEARLLLMTALLVADQLHDTKSGEPGAVSDIHVPGNGRNAAQDPTVSARLGALLARAEALATRLDS
ncbi:cell division protein ZapA [Sandarakinorhabdus sp.]|uniref:cell division protein ZapA n=1 Tax=Sandarakinorhabdus sp. TaxID=1916663 RepID=UPI00286DF0BC|nr:cell division protein ZapA [Sandarakinorhabdus sp.]